MITVASLVIVSPDVTVFDVPEEIKSNPSWWLVALSLLCYLEAV